MRRIVTTLSLALVLSLPACGGSGENDGEQVSSRATTTTTTGENDATTTTAPDTPTGGGEVQAGGGGTDPAPPSTSPPGDSGNGSGGGGSGGGSGETGSSGSGAPQPAAAGTYRYDTDGSTTTSGAVNQSRDLPDVTTLEIEQLDGGRQRSTQDMRDADGNGSVTTTVLQFKDGGVFLESIHIEATTSGFTVAYDFRPSPAPLVASAQPEVGDQFTFSMESTDGAIQADVTIDVQARETVSAAGQSVDALKVRTHTEFSGDVEGENTSTAHMSIEHRLTVREHSVSDARFGVTRSQTEYTTVIQKLTPS